MNRNSVEICVIFTLRSLRPVSHAQERSCCHNCDKFIFFCFKTAHETFTPWVYLLRVMASARRRLPSLSVNPKAPKVEGAPQKMGSNEHVMTEETENPSFHATASCFVKDNLAIHAKGVAKRNTAKTFTVNPADIELREEVGRGASSVVRRARHKPTGTMIVLKILRNIITEREKRHQLIREIEALYDADCPCLIKFYGAFYKEGQIAIALEFMDGGSLRIMRQKVSAVIKERCRARNIPRPKLDIPEKALASMAYQILAGLIYLKRKKRVHRDIKPANILLNNRGQVKISDFGISSELNNSVDMCGTFVGTCQYMSPERIRGGKYTYSSDIWSFGLVLIYLATGKEPYPVQDTHIGMLTSILDERAPFLDPTKFSKDICMVVNQAVHKDKDSRLPANIMIGSPLFASPSAGIGGSVARAATNVQEWIFEVRKWMSQGK